MPKRFCVLLSLLVAGSAAAQTVAPPDPADPKTTSPATTYESAFKGFRPYADVEIARWRDSNQEVGRLGGHRGHVPKSTRGASGAGEKPPLQRDHGSNR